MGLRERLGLYAELETLRDRPLIVYATSCRANAQGQISSDAIPELLDQIGKLPKGTKRIDLLIASNGGDPTVAWRIVSLLRERVDHLTVLVPQAAFSAATLLALGADEIVMHAHSNLGPVDPQITVHRKRQGSDEPELIQFGAEDLSSFLYFARTGLGISDQEHVRVLFERFCQEVGAVPVGVAARSVRLSMSLGEKLLRMHMTDGDSQKAKSIVESLNKDFFHHGYPLGRKEARQIGLKIVDVAPELEDLMWRIWLDIEEEFQARKPFDPTIELAGSPIAPYLFGPVPSVALPANLPPDVRQQAIQQVLAAVQVQQLPPVDVERIFALIESARRASANVSHGKIFACRLPNLLIQSTMVNVGAAWEQRALPAKNGEAG